MFRLYSETGSGLYKIIIDQASQNFQHVFAVTDEFRLALKYMYHETTIDTANQAPPTASSRDMKTLAADLFCSTENLLH